MTQEYIIKEITETAENVGWTVTTSKYPGSAIEVNFSTVTRFGQDLNCWGTLNDTDYQSLSDAIKKWHEGYDPEEEAMYWLGADGHGKNGAPYHMRDVLSDMEDAESRLEELAMALQQLDIE